MATQVYHRKRKPITSTSSPFSKLDVDLLLEVLIRLPDPRSAVRCKPVCKLWNSLIPAPYFVPRFLSRHPISVAGEPKPPPLTPSELRELILSFLPLPSHIESKFAVLDSAKDLLLLGFPQGKIGDQLHTTYLVCNPFTKQWVALPLAPKESARCSSIVKLVCQPCSNPPAPDFVRDGEALFPCHFGYRRFRVVRMYKLWKSADTMPVEVFCSRSGRWTKLVLPVHEDLRCCIDHGRKRVLSLNDKLYWLNSRGRVAKLDPFCLDHTTLPTLIHCPDPTYQSDYHWDDYYGPWASNGCVHVIHRQSRWFDWQRLSVWRVEQHKGRTDWKRLHEVVCVENLRCIGASCETEALGWRLDGVIGLHPERSEIVFMRCCHPRSKSFANLSCDFEKMELEFLGYQDKKSEGSAYHQDEELLQQPKVIFWPSTIPDYERLRSAYNGSYDCWLPPSN